ncbi:MAG: alpha/beta fold hydrolase [Egibacteraceae bacterium]
MLHAYRAGDGEPLLLIHGLGAHWRVWEPVLERLESSFEVFAPDLPGFGASPPLADGRLPDIPGLCDAVEAAMDEAGLGVAHAAGNALGGALALELGQRGRARTVCAIAPAGAAHGWEARWAVASLRALRASARALSPAMPMLTRSAVGRTLTLWPTASRPWRMDPEWAAALARAYADGPGFLPTLEAVDWARFASGLADVSCPVVIAWGSRDRLLLSRQGPRFAQAIPHARLVRLGGLGHTPMSDDPGAVADLIRRAARLG